LDQSSPVLQQAGARSPRLSAAPRPVAEQRRCEPHRPPASDCRKHCADVGCCTTKLENAHGTEFREVLYRWHPWFGLRVTVHEAVSRSDGIVFRCTLTGGRGRQLELPAWMFDRAACRDLFPLSTTPHATKAALCALADLLRDALQASVTASTVSLCGASCASRNEDVGEVRVRQDDGTPSKGTQGPPQAAAVRSVRRESAQDSRGHAGMVGPSGRGKKRPDRADSTADPGAFGANAAEPDSNGGRP